MSAPSLGRNAFVLYKQVAARILETGEKRIAIELASGEELRVRPKDVAMLHPGPLTDFARLHELNADTADLLAAWELLAGESTTLKDLVELAYDNYSPATVWAAWQMVADGLYFSGTPDDIAVSTPEQVAQESATREARQREQEAWESFQERVVAGQVIEEDGRYLDEVAELALGRRESSQVLRNLGREQTPENAHDLLLNSGYWDAQVNPYPSRAALDLVSAAGALPALPDEERRDLTYLTALAIDDEENEDPDDALSWEDGRLWVHVADVAALITPGSALDMEARNRGANLYLPEDTVTMLPEETTRRLGLGLTERSPALSIGLDLTANGRIENLEIVPSWVRVTRWTYEEAEERLQEPMPAKLLELARRYEARRRLAGAVEINLPEVRVTMRSGKVSIRPLLALQSRDLVREAMLMAGEAVAQFALQHDIPIPFTVQPPPDGELSEGETLSANFARRKQMQPSQQSIGAGVHNGLGMEVYAQVTSPLRRYLDLVIHQQLRAFLRGQDVLDRSAITERIGVAASIQRDLRRTERLSRQHWTLVYLLQNPAWRGEGVVVELHGRRHVTILPELDLGADLYLPGSHALDERLLLQLQEVNLPYLSTKFSAVTSPQSP